MPAGSPQQRLQLSQKWHGLAKRLGISRRALDDQRQRLHAREHAAVRKLVAMSPPPELRAWLRVLVRRSAIDFMREAPEFQRSSNRWVSLASLSSSAPSPEADTLAEKRVELTAYVRAALEQARRDASDDGQTRLALEWKIARIHVRRLVAKGDQYVAVLGAVLAGHSYPEVAEQLGVSRREVELTIRYVEELLQARGFAQ